MLQEKRIESEHTFTIKRVLSGSSQSFYLTYMVKCTYTSDRRNMCDQQ